MPNFLLHLGAALAGALTWTLSEYCLHRGLGHVKGAKNPFSVEHLHHHADLMYFAPTSKKLLAGGLVLAVTTPGLVALWGSVGFAAALGFTVMYGTYEYVHRRLHTHAPKTRYGRWARRHHLHHHFSRPQLNHGVSWPLWDYVFRTLDVPKVVKVPRKMALPWMLDANGELFPQYRADFEIIGRPLAREDEAASEPPSMPATAQA